MVVVSLAASAAAQTIFVVRHAERADGGTVSGGMMAADPDLSDAGRARATVLAGMLKDARITAIFTTEYKRTQQTAEPLARVLGITPTVVRGNDTAALIGALRELKANALVIGHSNTVPGIVTQLGIEEPVTLGDTEYDSLFVVTRGTPPSMVRLRMPASPGR